MMGIFMIRLGIHRGPLFRLEEHRKFRRKKCLVSLIWPTSGIDSPRALPGGMRYRVEFFYVSVLPDIEGNLSDGKHRKTLRGADLHLDNAPAHNAKRSGQEIGRTKTTTVMHPAYSPDTAPSDLFLFGYLKG
jgi:hypothetical protein